MGPHEQLVLIDEPAPRPLHDAGDALALFLIGITPKKPAATNSGSAAVQIIGAPSPVRLTNDEPCSGPWRTPRDARPTELDPAKWHQARSSHHGEARPLDRISLVGIANAMSIVAEPRPAWPSSTSSARH